MTYSELLKSDEWKEKRTQILTRDEYRCTSCENKALVASLEKGMFSKDINNKRLLMIRPFSGDDFIYSLMAENVINALPKKGGVIYRRLDKQGVAYPCKIYGIRSFTNAEQYDYFGRMEKIFKYYDNQANSVNDWLTPEVQKLLDAEIEREMNIHNRNLKKGLYIEFPISEQNSYSMFYGLHVHHKYYIKGKKTWDYDSNALITLCELCHENLHRDVDIPVYEQSGRRIHGFTACSRCDGIGFLSQYKHVLNGICFRCYGTKYEELFTS